MRPTHFQLATRDHPHALVEVELTPIRPAQFVGADEDMRKKAERNPRQRVAVVILDGPQQSTGFHRVRHCRTMSRARRDSALRNSEQMSRSARAVAMA